jgi:hypothetical protein
MVKSFCHKTYTSGCPQAANCSRQRGCDPWNQFSIKNRRNFFLLAGFKYGGGSKARAKCLQTET